MNSFIATKKDKRIVVSLDDRGISDVCQIYEGGKEGRMDITNPYKWKGIWGWIIIWAICGIVGFLIGRA